MVKFKYSLIKLMIIIVLILGVKFVFAETNNTYKCFAETHLNEAKILDARKLGGIKVGEIGLKYRVMVECRQDMPSYILWVQFIDSAKIDEQFDNTADFSIYIMVKNGKVTSIKRSVMTAINDIVNHCFHNKIEVKKFMHTVPKVNIKPGLAI